MLGVFLLISGFFGKISQRQQNLAKTFSHFLKIQFLSKSLTHFTNLNTHLLLVGFRKKTCTAPCLDGREMHSRRIWKGNVYTFQRRRSFYLVSLLLTQNLYFTPFSNVSIVDFEQVNVSWGFELISHGQLYDFIHFIILQTN